MKKRNPLLNNLSFIFLFVLWLLVAFRMWGGGYTGGDEPFTEMAATKSGGIFSAAWNMATSQGRFYQLWCYPIAQIPYLFDYIAWTNGFRIFSALFPVFCFYYLIKIVFSREMAVASCSVLALVQNTVGGSYNPFHSLPLWFSLGIAFVFLSYSFFIKWLHTNKYLSYSLLMFTLGILTYEVFLFYVLGFPIIAYFYRAKHINTYLSFKDNVIFSFGSTVWFLIVVVIYLLFYLSFRFVFHPSYEGVASLSAPTVSQFFKVISIFISSGVVLSAKNLIPNSSYYLILYVLALLLILLYSVRSDPEYKFNYGNNLWPFLLICIFFAIIPNVIFAFTERYRHWVINDPYYHGSYYSSFAVSLAIAICISYLNKFNGGFIKNIFRVSFLSVVFMILFSSGLKNHSQSISYFAESRKFADRWFFIQDLGAEIKNSNLILSSNVICTDALIGADDAYDYWSYKIEKYSGRSLKIVYSNISLECPMAIVRKQGNLVFVIDGVNFKGS